MGKTRCAICKIKLDTVSITIGKCRCDMIYCSRHRHPEQHQCNKLEEFKINGLVELKKQLIIPVQDLRQRNQI